MEKEIQGNLINAVKAIESLNDDSFLPTISNILSFLNGNVGDLHQDALSKCASFGSRPKAGPFITAFHIKTLVRQGLLKSIECYGEKAFFTSDSPIFSRDGKCDKDRRRTKTPSFELPSQEVITERSGYAISKNNVEKENQDLNKISKDCLFQEFEMALKARFPFLSKSSHGDVCKYGFGEIKDDKNPLMSCHIHADMPGVLFVNFFDPQKNEPERFALVKDTLPRSLGSLLAKLEAAIDWLRINKTNEGSDKSVTVAASNGSMGSESVQTSIKENASNAASNPSPTCNGGESTLPHFGERPIMEEFLPAGAHVELLIGDVPSELLGDLAERSVFSYPSDMKCFPEACRERFKDKKNFLCRILKWKAVAWSRNAEGFYSYILVVDRQSKKFWMLLDLDNRRVLFYSEEPVIICGRSGLDILSAARLSHQS